VAQVPDPLAALLELAGVGAATQRARASVDTLLGHRVLRRGSAAVSAESSLRGARAAAALAGAPYPLAEVRAGQVRDPVVQGALRVGAEIGRLVPTWERAPRQALARLHVLASDDSRPAEHRGRPRADPEAVARLDTLVGLLAPGVTRVPAVVLAAVVLGELSAVRPFAGDNDVVAFAAARLTLISRGLDPKAVSVPEVGHLEMAVDAAGWTAFRASYAEGTASGLARWVVHCADATALGAREGLAICEATVRAGAG